MISLDGGQPMGAGASWMAYEMFGNGKGVSRVTFDIHAGGLDLIFPHHENEIAQSCCAHKTDMMAEVLAPQRFCDNG